MLPWFYPIFSLSLLVVYHVNSARSYDCRSKSWLKIFNVEISHYLWDFIRKCHTSYGILYYIMLYHIISYHIILYYIIQYTCVHVLALFLPDIKMPHILSHVNIGLQYYPQCQHVYIYIIKYCRFLYPPPNQHRSCQIGKTYILNTCWCLN